ncbi:PA0069 family radical SAM protein [Roseomonas sp. NAR14]|uniref:PA0069 family radical SAM protein n=1 Tax=Roseomonas acroporae TaxID=2937791 RepID=A0A9X2BXY8_9PROT|nr:PA0069 family radical SAM protein [Roseomonas acroporae]MCK8787796.1 PA0069 family radical SAM protein [Roseomonas acroporae]
MPDGHFLPAGTATPNARPLKGRGAASNPANRYERTHAEPWDDGWDTLARELAELPPLPTTLTPDRSRSAIAWNDSPDIGFDRSVNPYRGCEHGCIYCYARPSHAHLGFSPGLEFETRLLYKPDIAALLERELRRPGYVPRPIALGSNTDPYQPVERTLSLTRQVLEVLERFGHPVTIVTKSTGVLRDLDILRRLAERNLVHVCLSVTTLDPVLARRMEPRAAAPLRRLAAIGALAAAGVPAGVLAAPMIPGLNDAELERILAEAARHGATRAGYVLLRLPLEVRPLFEEWLGRHFPDRAARVLSLIRETRGGGMNDSRFGRRQTGAGPYADLLARRFALASSRLGFDRTGLDRCHEENGAAGARGTGRLDRTLFRVPEDGGAADGVPVPVPAPAPARAPGRQAARQLALF